MNYYGNFGKTVRELSARFDNVIKQMNEKNYVYKSHFFEFDFSDYRTFIKIRIVDLHDNEVLCFNIQKESIRNTETYFYDCVVEQFKIKISYYYDLQIATEFETDLP
jgi:hypothetical protein